MWLKFTKIENFFLIDLNLWLDYNREINLFRQKYIFSIIKSI
jgi:hypothetical protein